MFIIDLNIVKVRFKNKTLLNNFSTKLNYGQTIGVIGKNGTGKSTLFKVIMNKIKFEGSVSINPIDIGIVSDYSSLPSELKVKDIINLHSDKEKYRVQELINIFELNNLINNKISKLSTGEKRKLELYNVLMQNKKIYIFDEITSGLDQRSSEELLNIINIMLEQNKKLIILYSTHNLTEFDKLPFDKYWVFENSNIHIYNYLTEKEIIKYY